MIRIDESHLYAGKRGVSSDLMKWLRRQADWGSMTAQVSFLLTLSYSFDLAAESVQKILEVAKVCDHE